jgi:hypothetical protein
MKRSIVLILLASSAAFAAELEVPLRGKSSLTQSKPVSEILVRDPSLLSVVVTDGAASLEGKKSGVTAVTVTYAVGEVERSLVIVGEGAASPGMNTEQAKKVDLKQSAGAHAKAKSNDRPSL